MTDDDPYRWLEDVAGEAPLAWVGERNAETFAELTGSTRFAALRAEIREVLDADEPLGQRPPDATRPAGYRVARRRRPPRIIGS